jgi:hypothetical protein
MWEDVLAELRELPAAAKPELGITEVLSAVRDAVREFVPSEWANGPHMCVSDLTRESLRRILTVFMGTGVVRSDGSEYAASLSEQVFQRILMLSGTSFRPISTTDVLRFARVAERLAALLRGSLSSRSLMNLCVGDDQPPPIPETQSPPRPAAPALEPALSMIE